MELRQLRYFLTVAEELHFGRAAEREHLAQPAFSQLIRRLEQELDVQLFDRTSRRVQLTEPGRLFVELARGIVERADDAVALVRQASHGREGRLRLAFASGTDRGVPAAMVDQFRADYPLVELTLSMQYDEENRVELRAGDIDAAYFWMPLGDFDDLAWCTVTTEPLVAVVRARHALASLAAVTPEQMAAEPFVWFARHWSPGLWDSVIVSLFGDRGLAVNVALEEVSQESMVRGVLATEGVTIVTATTAQQLTVPGVVYRPFADALPSCDIGLAWRADNTSPVLKALVETATALVDSANHA